ncbi:MAG: ubiquinone/menaquinone biosynthesis C-methylase UbiE [Bradymonadia bacterium]|jgi:ubiquinone/menaquinone biosynthesis C-methylase UbiE
MGVDLSPTMVAITHERLQDAAEISVGDMRELPHIESGTATRILSFFALHHLSGDRAAGPLSEWARVLGPGGRAALTVWEGSGAID